MNTAHSTSQWTAAAEHDERTVVLVVDDEFGIRSVVSRALARQGYQVVMAGNGREALTMLNSTVKFSLVLLDVDMPEMNGFEAMPFIRRAAPEVPVVFMTGHLDDDSARGVLTSGADGVIPKPFELVRLVQSVDRMIERRRLALAARRHAAAVA